MVGSGVKEDGETSGLCGVRGLFDRGIRGI